MEEGVGEGVGKGAVDGAISREGALEEAEE